MAQNDIISNTNWLVLIGDETERKTVLEALSSKGAKTENIRIAEDSLELLLMSVKSEKGLAVIAGEGAGPIDLKSVLENISARDRYSTIGVIADDWSEGCDPGLREATDVFLSRPVSAKTLLPGMTVDLARKKKLMDLEAELGRSEEDFAKEKNLGFAKHLIMDKLGLSEEGAGEYLLSIGEKHGYAQGDVARLIYEVLLAGDKEK